MFNGHLEHIEGALDELLRVYIHNRTDLARIFSSKLSLTPEMMDSQLNLLRGESDCIFNVSFTNNDYCS